MVQARLRPNNNTAAQQQQTQNLTIALGPMQAGIPSAMTPGPYGPMGNGPPGYMRSIKYSRIAIAHIETTPPSLYDIQSHKPSISFAGQSRC